MKLKAVVLLVCLAVVAYAATYESARVAGTNTAAGNIVRMVQDSTDTFVVDTHWSDTIDVQSAAAVQYAFEFYDFVAADSANDSLTIICQALTSFDGIAWHIISVDTLTDHAGGLDDSLAARHYYATDTLLYNKLAFRTIYADSFIMGAGIDTSTIQSVYHVLQR